MIQERDIRQQLASHIAGKVSLAAFERWLGIQSWNMFNDSPDAIKLVAAINLLVSELHDGMISSDQFQAESLALLNNNALRVANPVMREASRHRTNARS